MLNLQMNGGSFPQQNLADQFFGTANKNIVAGNSHCMSPTDADDQLYATPNQKHQLLHHNQNKTPTTTHRPPLQHQQLQQQFSNADEMFGSPTTMGTSGSGGQYFHQQTPTKVSGMNLSGSVANSGGTNGSNLVDTSAYCEICDKQLCNRYFLKTHKFKKHGIGSAQTQAQPFVDGIQAAINAVAAAAGGGSKSNETSPLKANANFFGKIFF